MMVTVKLQVLACQPIGVKFANDNSSQRPTHDCAAATLPFVPMTLLRSLLKTFQGIDRPPVSTARTLEEKDALASWIVKAYFQNGSSTLESVLEREADIRFCSLLSYHISKLIFGASGSALASRVANITESMGYRLAEQRSGRLADTRAHANMSVPVKYRGYGSTLNNPDARGHLFQINMLCFVDRNPLIGVHEMPDTDSIYPTKGMKEAGRNGLWRLFRIDPELSDDMTALMVNPDSGDVKEEFAHFSSPDDKAPAMIYRINTAR